MTDLTTYLITPDAQSKMDGAQSAAASLARMEAWQCETVEDQSTVARMLSMVQTKIAEIEELRTSITRPLLETKRRIDALFSSIVAPFDHTKGVLKGKLADVARAQALALEQAREAARAGEIVPVVPEVVTPTQWEWTYEIENVNKMPRDFLCPNHAAIKMHMGLFRKSETIDGVDGIRFTRQPKVIARR